MNIQNRWPVLAWVPACAGALWLWYAARAGALPAAGIGGVAWPGDRRMTQAAGLAGAAGVVLAFPLIWLLGFASAFWVAVLAAASFLASGRLAIHQEPFYREVPAPKPELLLDAKVAVDEVVLGLESLRTSLPGGGEALRMQREIEGARALYADRGWLDDPAAFHDVPPGPASPRLSRKVWRQLSYELLEFESGYEPHNDEPARDRYLGFHQTRTARALVLRHGDDRDRGWLVCNNGYRMGFPYTDLPLFRRHYEEQGLNLLIPVLPLHGSRRIGRQSGDGFLAGEVLDTIHAEAQAMWDIRSMLTWLREQGATRIGVHGVSLGGYTTALLAGLADDLACAIPGIPVSDFARIFWRHGPRLQLQYLEELGTSEEDVRECFRVVSPLALPCRVPLEHRALFGGVADRLVPPIHVRDLWEHWERPRIEWYQGAHCTFGVEGAPKKLIDETLQGAKLLD